MAQYAELQVSSNFSFLRGASDPRELIETAAQLQYEAIALTDRNTLSGIVLAHSRQKKCEHKGTRFIVGCRLDLLDGPSLLCYPKDRAAYGRLTRLLTIGRRRARKGECHLKRADVEEHAEGQYFIVPAPRVLEEKFVADLRAYAEIFAGRLHVAATYAYRGDDVRRIGEIAALCKTVDLPMVAANDVLYHAARRKVLQDVLTCIREKCTLAQAGFHLHANAERHLKTPAEMKRLFARWPYAIEAALEIAACCRFSLDELRYEYPDEIAEPGVSALEDLRRRTWAGATQRYPDGIPDTVVNQIEHEFKLIAEREYAPYFLTVHNIVKFAKEKGILHQGRDSAANSVICYCLGITQVDPVARGLLFERFISAARNEPPDIDVDFEHERREEVIQFVYEKYGRERAGIASTVVHYRTRRAIREVGKALGLSEDVTGALAGGLSSWSTERVPGKCVREAGLDPLDRRLRLALKLAHELIGFPRHLSQHVGGFVIARGRLDELAPIENAAMKDRTIVQWDKDDLDELGMMKVDLLGLGMLTAIRISFDLLKRHYGQQWTLATIPKEDPGVYAMLQRADSIGVFQVESRAQQSMLPRMKPAEFYDLVIEVAIVRPGPIQGDMVHPYLRRREGKEEVEYPSEALREVLRKTLGVPLFQEQAMQIAIIGAGFTPDEADQLRRALATFRHVGTISTFRERFIQGMIANNYAPEYAERCFRQIEGFGTYGFPESHAISFANVVYVSAWIKHHYPCVFCAALLNSQPMGFYAPAQLVRDAQENGVEIRPIDVNYSDWDTELEPGVGTRHAVRLGLRLISGLTEKDGRLLVERRGRGYDSVTDIVKRTGLSREALDRMAQADSFGSLQVSRRQAIWRIRGNAGRLPPLFARSAEKLFEEPAADLPEMTRGQEVIADYAMTGLTLRDHPMALLRAHFARERVTPAAKLKSLPNEAHVTVAGLVLFRQRPGTAKGTVLSQSRTRRVLRI